MDALRRLPDVVLMLGAWATLRLLQVSVLGWGTGGDPWIYERYAAAWASGAIPYVDFHPEYPPGALPLFIAPWLIGGTVDYVPSFRWLMLVLELACFVLVCRAIQSRWETRRERLRVAAIYLAGSVGVMSVIFMRYDIAPTLFAFLAWWLYQERDNAPAAGASLGIGAALKLWPGVLAPVLFVALWMRRERRRATSFALAFAASLTASWLLVAWRAGPDMLEFLGYHRQRGIHIGSTWASISMIADHLGAYGIEISKRFGAEHLDGALPALFIHLTPAATLTGLALPIAILLVRRDDAISGDLTLLAAAASVLGLLIASNVLSVQFIVWLLPFVPLLWRQSRACVWMLLTAALMNAAYYPHLFHELIHGRSAILGTLTVSARNGLLIASYVTLLRRMHRYPAHQAT